MQTGVALDHRIGLERDVGVDPGGRGIDDRHAFAHPAGVDAVTQHRSRLGELSTVVDAEDLVGVGRDDGSDRVALIDVQPQHVGEVFLAL